ncbi:MAG: hypothetical protein KKD69_07830 [Euryarchaeota archaeon]|nr:hypothetical protein [Euryarchaeota archaeon]MBU4492354.1 hypothetical protein [Euryarchaeota archaeon]
MKNGGIRILLAALALAGVAGMGESAPMLSLSFSINRQLHTPVKSIQSK